MYSSTLQQLGMTNLAIADWLWQPQPKQTLHSRPQWNNINKTETVLKITEYK